MTASVTKMPARKPTDKTDKIVELDKELNFPLQIYAEIFTNAETDTTQKFAFSAILTREDIIRLADIPQKFVRQSMQAFLCGDETHDAAPAMQQIFENVGSDLDALVDAGVLTKRKEEIRGLEIPTYRTTTHGTSLTKHAAPKQQPIRALG